MARQPRALRTKEEIAAVPLDQPVNLDLSDDPVVTIIKDDEPETKAAPIEPPAPKEEPPVEDPEKLALRKQVESLQAAQAAWNQQQQDQQRRTEELERRSAQDQVSRLESDYNAIVADLGMVEEQIKSAKLEGKRAAEAGDYDAQMDAQARLGEASAYKVSLQMDQARLADARERAKAAPKPESQPAPTQPQQGDQIEAFIAQQPISDLSKNWLRSHRDYMTVRKLNLQLQLAHESVVERGIQAHTPAYIEAIETELGLRQSPDEDPPEPRRTPVSAPVSRDVPSPSTGKSSPGRVTLSAEEREHARFSMPGTDPGEAERIYAAKKLELQKLKAQGHYQER